jgi:hypothetical protein
LVLGRSVNLRRRREFVEGDFLRAGPAKTICFGRMTLALDGELFAWPKKNQLN